MSKMSIASKEARETAYWIKLLDASGYLDGFKEKNVLLKEINNIVNILTRIVKTLNEDAN
ncbi:hypothetical protein DBT_0850 [Dissulfuribacter thermophilus]|uniref:Four helix bundle protein n=1 Tax=Dissulfuribacter thermophilus TaxID=1156395 RepID=A0A1B9F7Z0_9BACT|nr:hypothetical protein DBT_0850 [Dissulfuribacter thermophilus]